MYPPATDGHAHCRADGAEYWDNQESVGKRSIFNPTLGYGAGAMLAARFCQREWIRCILLGWGVGGAYWSSFRVRPPGVKHMPFEYH